MLYRETRTAVVSLTPTAAPYMPSAPLSAVLVRLTHPTRLGADARDNEEEALRVGATALRLVAGLAYSHPSRQRYTLTPHPAERRSLSRPMNVRVIETWVSRHEDMLDASVEAEHAETLAR